MMTSAVRYTRTAIALHWIIAILIAAMIALGLYMTDLPRNTPERSWYFNLHKSIGLLTAGIILLRVFWRLRFSPPRLAGSAPTWQAAAKTSHVALYACMVFMPLTGYLGSAFNKYGVKFFGLPLPNWAWDDPKLREIFVTAHHWIASVLIGLIALHVAAALYHALKRDGVFARMWFAGAR
jgi:cytochrome b561